MVRVHCSQAAAAAVEGLLVGACLFVTSKADEVAAVLRV